ncbi:MAG: deoxyribose-phosphate aldolase [Actinomycetota bacterium]
MENPAIAMNRRAISLLDLTELGDDATDADVIKLCEKAHGPYGNTAAVCVWPRHVALAVEQLWGTNIRVATVVNFPTGDEPIDDVVTMTRQALADGADEIDLVVPYKSFLAGDVAHATAMIDAVRAEVPADSHRLKVILETGETGRGVRELSQLAISHGADFIKTSTGKTRGVAQIIDSGVMLKVIRDADRPVGLKPSGGIRQADDARDFIAQADGIMGAGWATPETFRFGASGLLDALTRGIEGDASATSTEAY